MKVDFYRVLAHGKDFNTVVDTFLSEKKRLFLLNFSKIITHFRICLSLVFVLIIQNKHKFYAMRVTTKDIDSSQR